MATSIIAYIIIGIVSRNNSFLWSRSKNA